jgi:hypothetical protein
MKTAAIGKSARNAILVLIAVVMVALAARLLLFPPPVSEEQLDIIAHLRKNDLRVAKMYELFPRAEARFNKGNRAGRRGAFAPIEQTFALSAKLPGDYTLKLYRGMATQWFGGTRLVPLGTVKEAAYGLLSPKGQLADLTVDEFDALLGAKGDVNVLKKDIWTRQPLPSVNLAREQEWPWPRPHEDVNKSRVGPVMIGPITTSERPKSIAGADR